MTIKKSYLAKLRKNLHSYQLKRREIIREAGDALHHAKRVIFSLHRDNLAEAKEKLKESEAIFKKLQTKFKKEPKLLNEGAYRAGLEEYAEAVLFYQFITTGKVGEVSGPNMEEDVYLAGLCDVPGELYRYAIKSATKRDMKMVKKCAAMSNEIIGELIEFDLTSYLRNKFDQAKQANHKLEQVVYEVSLKE